MSNISFYLFFDRRPAILLPSICFLMNFNSGVFPNRLFFDMFGVDVRCPPFKSSLKSLNPGESLRIISIILII